MTLWLLTVRLRLPGVTGTVATSAAMLALAGAQGFIRPDVIVATHLGIIVLCLTRAGEGFSVGRGVQAATSALAVLIAGGVQVYLMHVVYPHAGYGSTRVFELVQNLTKPLGALPFVLFLLPWSWLVVTLARRRASADAPSLAMVAGSSIYMVTWFVLGRIEEVRIFLPFAVVLVPLTCECAMERFAEAKGEQPASA